MSRNIKRKMSSFYAKRLRKKPMMLKLIMIRFMHVEKSDEAIFCHQRTHVVCVIHIRVVEQSVFISMISTTQEGLYLPDGMSINKSTHT